MALKAFRADDYKIVDYDNNKANETVVNLSKNLIYILNIGVIEKLIFLIPNT